MPTLTNVAVAVIFLAIGLWTAEVFHRIDDRDGLTDLVDATREDPT